MKKLSSLILAGSLVAALAFSFSPVLRAQDQDQSPQPDQAKGGRSAEKGGWGKSHMGWGPMGKLGLTDDQQAKMKELFKSRGEDMKPLKDHVQLDRDTLRLQVDSNASKSELTSTMEKLSNDQKALRSSQEKFQDKLKSILTPKQQAQMILFKGGHRGGGFGCQNRGGKGSWGKPGMGRAHGHWDKSKKSKRDGSKDTPAPPADQN